MGVQQELADAIDKILWEDWDPIGVNDQPSARDEYSGYVAEVFSLALANSPVEEIAKRLNLISNNTIGVGENIDHSKMVARKILDIKNKLIQ